MKIQPNHKKLFKEQKGKTFNRVANLYSLKRLSIGSYALIASESGRLTGKQINCFYQVINKSIKKFGRVLIPVSVQTPITKKPLEVRMGKGKGSIDHWVAKIKTGTVLCEIVSSSSSLSRLSLIKAMFKLPIKTKLIQKY
jgi:large subunit ribosomal protein L16